MSRPEAICLLTHKAQISEPFYSGFQPEKPVLRRWLTFLGRPRSYPGFRGIFLRFHPELSHIFCLYCGIFRCFLNHFIDMVHSAYGFLQGVHSALTAMVFPLPISSIETSINSFVVLAALELSSASLPISSATTAKPLPASLKRGPLLWRHLTTEDLSGMRSLQSSV